MVWGEGMSVGGMWVGGGVIEYAIFAIALYGIGGV